jgi:hypothetical protein
MAAVVIAVGSCKGVALQMRGLQLQQTAQQPSWITRIAQRLHRNMAVALDVQQLRAAATAAVLQQQQQHQAAAFTCWQTAGQALL